MRDALPTDVLGIGGGNSRFTAGAMRVGFDGVARLGLLFELEETLEVR